MYCQSTFLDALTSTVVVEWLQICCQSINTYWGSLLSKYQHFGWVSLCTVKVPTLTEGVTSTVVVLSEYLPWVSPNMLVIAPNSGGVSCQSTNTLRESPGMYCQSTNTYWGSHANRCCTVRVPYLGVSRYAVKASTFTEGVFYQSSNTLRDSPDVLSEYRHLLRELHQSLWYCQSILLGYLQLCCRSTNVCWGSLLSNH